MQIKDPHQGVVERVPQKLERVLELHKPLADALQDGDCEEALGVGMGVSPLHDKGTQRLTEIRARVLSGAYLSLEIADHVARAILRSGIVTFPSDA